MKEEITFRNSKRLAHTRAYFGSPTVEPPAPRDITQEMLQTLRGSQQVAGPQFALESQYQPLYQQLGLTLQRQNMLGFDDAEGHHPGGLEMGRYGTQFQRAGDIADVQTLGPEAYEAQLNANPLLRRSLAELTGRLPDSDILRRLNLQATEELDAGGALSPAQARMADQDARAVFADRGMLHGDQSAGAELLNREAFRTGRLNAARQFAGAVQGMNQNQNDFTGRVAQIAGSQFDPFLAIMNRSSSGQGGGAQQQIGTGARLFDPMNPYAQDAFNTNYNAQAAANIANANNDAATSNAYLGAGSAIAAAAIVAI